VVVDVDDLLSDLMGRFNAFGDATVMRDFEVRHPRYPAAGMELVLATGHLYLAVVDPRSGRGNAFIGRAMVDGRPASPEELAAFRRLLASIRFDPERYCRRAPEGDRERVAT